MKFILPMLFPLLAPTIGFAEAMVDCQITQEKACTNCLERIQASCSDENLNGAFDRNYRPSRVDLKVVNHVNGTEKIVSVPNSKFTFSDLQSPDKIAGLAKQSGIKLAKKETVEVYQVRVLTSAKFFKDTEGTEIASMGNPSSAARSIASDVGAANKIGGITRAQQLAPKKATGKDSK